MGWIVPVVAVLLIGGSCGDDGDAADGEASKTTSVEVAESEVESPITTSTTEATTSAELAGSSVAAGEGSAERVVFADAVFVDAAAEAAVGVDGVVWVYLTGNPRPGVGHDGPSIVRGDGGQWVKVATEDDIPSDLTNFSGAPTFVGVDADGGLWLTQDAWGFPSGPYVLWHFDGQTWTDHSEASGLPGPAGTDAMSCCAVAVDPDGTVWAENPPVSRFFDGTSWVDGDPGEGAYQVTAREGETSGLSAYPGDDAGRSCRRFYAEYAPDGSLWYTAPCHNGFTLGDFIEFDALMRVGPDETTTVYDLRSVDLPGVILDFDIGPDGTVWVAGEGALTRLVPDAG